MNGLTPTELLLQQVGEINGKLDGILTALEDIKDEEIRCHADRDDIRHDMGKLRDKQSWIIGLGTGVTAFIGAVGAFLHYR